MERKTVVYIAGPITGVEKYWEAFEKAEDEILAIGCIPLSPSRLPVGLTEEQYMRISLATIDVVDAVYFLPGWAHSKGARLEYEYSAYKHKLIFTEMSRLKEELE